MNRCRLGIVGWLAGLVALCAGCAITLTSPSSQPPAAALSVQERATGAALSNPRQVELEFVATIGPITLLEGEALRAANHARGVPEDQPPTLLVWSAGPQTLMAQKPAGWRQIEPEPNDVFRDEENGNSILFWDLSHRLTNGSTIEIRRRFVCTTHEWTPLAAPAPEMTETHPRLMALYTREEPFLQLTDEMREAAYRAIGEESRPIAQAERLFQFVRAHMTYVYPPEERHALHALHSGKGDCGQYSYLFIALCRSLKIPARQQSGFRVGAERVGYHVWSEFFAPPYGWIPVDATEEEGFGRLDNERLVASVGTHIPLRHAPNWATNENSDVEDGRTDFMQFMTAVKSGFEAPVKTERRILRVENLE